MRLIPYNSARQVDDFGLQISQQMYDTTLAAGVEQTLTVPGSAPKYKAVLDFGKAGDVWVAVNNTATVAGAAFATTDSRLNPKCLEVKGGDVMHFISGGTPAVSVAFYALESNI